MEAYTKKITCPEHGTVKHKATLYMHGHKYAGIWECDMDGNSEACEHVDTHVEIVESNPTHPLDSIYNSRVHVCNLCDCTVEIDDDEADLFAEMGLDCAD
jgi:hypothetical protein